MTASPVRVQMSRQRPWRPEHPTAVVVARPSRLGNPWAIAKISGGGWAVLNPDRDLDPTSPHLSEHTTRAEAATAAVERFREWLSSDSISAQILRHDLPALAGRDLACWCPPTQDCHADVLIAMTVEATRA